MYKENFQKSIENIEAFWQKEDIGRPVISVTAPLNDSSFRAPKSLEEKWLDTDYIYSAFKHRCENTYFGGEAFHSHFVNFGPGSLAAFVGSDFQLAEDTVWFDRVQIIKDWNNIPDFKIDKTTTIWQKTVEQTEKFLEDKNIITTVSDIGGIMDIIASLRGTEALLYDLYDHPDEVKSVINKIDDLWKEAFDEFNGIISKKQEYSSSWMGISSKLPYFPIQCDFSAMLSPALFEEFVLPSLVKHTEHLPRTIYHLDGPGEIPHLDMLLDIDNLTAIQWVSGSGQPGLGDPRWLPMYKKIQEKNKCLVLAGIGADEIEFLLSNVDRRGLYISTSCSSQQEADVLIENTKKWSR